MMAKSTITTAEADALLHNGWVLKERKTIYKDHLFYVHDESRRGMPCSARYINKAVFDALTKRRHSVWPNMALTNSGKDEGAGE